MIWQSNTQKKMAKIDSPKKLEDQPLLAKNSVPPKSCFVVCMEVFLV